MILGYSTLTLFLNFPKLTQEDITKQMLEFVSNNKHLTNLSHCNLRRRVEASTCV